MHYLRVKVFVIGATGKVGQHTVEYALEKGHEVTAFGRAALTGFDGKPVKVVVGNPMSTDDLAKAMAGHDVVLSALGTRGLGGPGACVVTDGARHALEAMKQTGVRRFAIVSSTLNDPNQPWIPRTLARTLLKHHAADQREMEKIVTVSDSEWTIVRPPKLSNGKLTKQYRVSDEQITDGPGSLSRRDVADFLVELATNGGHAKKVTWIRR